MNCELTDKIIGSAIEVHRELGPGLLESTYEQCLCHELATNGIQFERQLELPVNYKNINLDCGYRIDVMVEKQVIVELKAVKGIEEIHRAQLLTYMKLSGIRLGLLLNFNMPLLKDGIVRLVL